ncbi:MAG TPA: class I SAM-dependent methyltransferase [Flavobacteriales bacterium]
MAHTLFRIRQYLRHRLQAGDRHDVHSPFIFRLVNEVLRKDDPQPYRTIEALRERLLRSDREITVTDHGAGSLVLKGRERRVADIARTALKSPRRARQLTGLVRFTGARTILELGTSLGLTTLHLAQADPQGHVITLEGCPATHELALENFRTIGATNITAVQGRFADRLPEVLRNHPRIDLAFLDGHHERAATGDLFHRLLPHLHGNSLLVFDDIHWSPGMHAAWEEVKAHPQVTVTVDLFDMGLVFFHSGQAKEHFRLKY